MIIPRAAWAPPNRRLIANCPSHSATYPYSPHLFHRHNPTAKTRFEIPRKPSIRRPHTRISDGLGGIRAIKKYTNASGMLPTIIMMSHAVKHPPRFFSVLLENAVFRSVLHWLQLIAVAEFSVPHFGQAMASIFNPPIAMPCLCRSGMAENTRLPLRRWKPRSAPV